MDKSGIRRALERLLERRNSGAFVISKEKQSGKFVRFAGGAGQGLTFDLPAQQLDGEELDRAQIALGEYGIHMEEWEIYDRPGAGLWLARRAAFRRTSAETWTERVTLLAAPFKRF